MARKTLHPVEPDPEMLELQKRLQRLGYGYSIRADGYPSNELWEAVERFQMQHSGPSGKPLTVDGVVGPSTWWALDNPSGAAQRNGFALAMPPRDQLTANRWLVLDTVAREYRLDVREEPDGSNRGPQVDGYWGHTGIIGEPWCCALVSTILRRALKRYPLGEHFVSCQKMLQKARELGLVTERPRPGDIWVQVRPRGAGHTGFAAAFSATDVATFEGNAGNRLKHGRRRLDTIDAWIDVYRDGQAEILQDLPELDQLDARTR
jgi:hypothetical protein